MKPQSKSIFIIIGTLLIGMVLGSLVDGYVRSRIREKIFEGPRPDRFGALINRIVQPDSAQAVALKEVIDRYAPKVAEQHQRHFLETRALVDSMNAELRPILTEEQMERLMNRLNRFQRGMRRPGMGPGMGRGPGMGPDRGMPTDGPPPDGLPPGDPPPPPPDDPPPPPPGEGDI